MRFCFNSSISAMLCREDYCEQCIFFQSKKSNITCILMMDPWDSSLGVFKIHICKIYRCESIIIKRCNKSRKHAHCFSIKWKAENDRVLNYYLPILIFVFHYYNYLYKWAPTWLYLDTHIRYLCSETIQNSTQNLCPFLFRLREFPFPRVSQGN